MEQVTNELRFHYTDAVINELLKNGTDGNKPCSLHYDHNENFFLELEKEFIVPHLPIHHDVRISEPKAAYLNPIQHFIQDLIPLIPQVFAGLTFFFDPAEILRPSFFQLYKVQEQYFLYLLRIDLVFKTHEGEILQRGTNDSTPEYRTRHLFLERDLIPLDHVDIVNGKIRTFLIKQTISQTWIGETGRGYFVQGIWMDNELTKFFSKLFLPKGKRTYPYYPFTCKYRTICHSLLLLDGEGRKLHIKWLIDSIRFILPEIESIQNALKNNEFSENLPYFQNLKEKIPPELTKCWESLKVHQYLNDRDMREFLLEF